MLAKTAVGLMRVTTHAQLLLDLAKGLGAYVLVANCGMAVWIQPSIVMIAITGATPGCYAPVAPRSTRATAQTVCLGRVVAHAGAA